MISSLPLLHARLLLTITLLAGMLTLWGVLAGLLRWAVQRWYRAGLGVLTLLVLSECAVGVALWLSGARAAQMPLHVVYGIVAAAVIPGTQRYLRAADQRSYHLGTALACGFLIGVALRALATGRGA